MGVYIEGTLCSHLLLGVGGGGNIGLRFIFIYKCRGNLFLWNNK